MTKRVRCLPIRGHRLVVALAAGVAVLPAVASAQTNAAQATSAPGSTTFVIVHGARARPSTAAPTVTEEAPPPSTFDLGPVTISGGLAAGAGRSGIDIVAALPIAAVPGLDAVVDARGGRADTTGGATIPDAAVTAGLRLRF